MTVAGNAPEFRLADRIIGPEHPPLVIAEAGINHEGEFDKAIEMIDAAHTAGAECVKFQCHIVEAEMTATDMTPGEISSESLWQIIERCQLTEEEEVALKEYCEQRGMIFLSTPFSREAADRLERMEVCGFKIGSGECNNLPLLQHVAAKGKPIILSTGMNDLASIRRSVNAIQAERCPLMLMHCTSAYPTPYESVRLGCIEQLASEFGVPVGLSDHSIGVYVSVAAVAVGACVLEKHFTVSRAWPGPDNPISIEPEELASLVEGTLAVHHALGGDKTVLPIEQPVIDFAYASVVTIADVRAGEVLSLANTWVKRPGTGELRAHQLQDVLGRKTSRDLAQGSQISLDDLA